MSTDLAQHAYTNYIFLHSGLIDTTNNLPTVSHANTFVRVFPDIGNEIPQPWLVPFPTPPSFPATLQAEAQEHENNENMELRTLCSHTAANGILAAGSRCSRSIFSSTEPVPTDLDAGTTGGALITTSTVTPAWSRESAAGSESSDNLNMPPLEDVTSEDVDELMSESEKDWNEMRKEITDELAIAKGACDETDCFLKLFCHYTGLHPSNDLLSFLGNNPSPVTSSFLRQPHPTPEPDAEAMPSSPTNELSTDPLTEAHQT
ncbi:hypothetical protein FIBSPDRAFT_963777 [Athelia psychrophila]|uniref:Uncharacterized protein n=1 Tax=Athelia psychrophila TaxID=1759441 RepID=A0A165YKJ3_9AGAM|nr:hypothetical protein FIBSPDRAFT_963777 [Fibularhizoctonia sp. CBS 109695]